MSTIYEYTYTGAAIVSSSSVSPRSEYKESGVLIDAYSTRIYDLLLIRFPAFPSSLLYKKLISAKLRFEARQSAAETGLLYIYSLDSDFDPATVAWSTMPGISNTYYGYRIFTSSATSYAEGLLPDTYYIDSGSTTDPVQIAKASKQILTSNSVAVKPGLNDYIWIKGAPVLIIEVDESVTITSQISPVNSPTSGWINPTIAQTFSWKFTYSGDYPCPGNFEQASAVFHWRAGTSGSWNDVPASGQSVTIPANTFPGGTVQWYISGTDTQGTSSQTSVYTVTTEDSEAVATATEPSGTVEDGSAPIVFKWTVTNDSGSTPTGADLQSSTDGETWTDFAHVSGSNLQYSAPANTFAAGVVFWRVRAYNRDNVAGSWSSSKQFVSVAAPAAPAVSVDAVPFATISWQSEGQQAYRVTVDGKVYGPYFGSAKRFELPDYLGDGGHTAAVEIQGVYGLWSAPGTVSFSVANVPGAAITLRGTFYRDAELSWSTEDQTADFFIYRDGVRIGHTGQLSFADRTVLGDHSWQVINRLPGGYYTASNAVQGELRSCCTAIAPLAGGAWLELRKSASESSEQSFAASRQISLRHFEGAAYPVAEISPFLDLSGSYDVAFLYSEAEAAAQFEAMLGSTVILKSRGGECLVGILSGYAKRNPRFYRAYSFSVQRIHWRDFVDEND